MKTAEQLKVGDVLVAIDPCCMNGDLNSRSLTIGKAYPIESMGGDIIAITDDHGERHCFSLTDKLEEIFTWEGSPYPVPDPHAEKLKHFKIVTNIAGFKFPPRDLDLFVSLYDLFLVKGEQTDLYSISDVIFEVDERHKCAKPETTKKP